MGLLTYLQCLVIFAKGLRDIKYDVLIMSNKYMAKTEVSTNFILNFKDKKYVLLYSNPISFLCNYNLVF